MSFGFKKKKIHSTSPLKPNIANYSNNTNNSVVNNSSHSVIIAADKGLVSSNKPGNL